MTQEEKQLLLVDLSARLTHKVKIKCDGYPNGIVATGIVGDQVFHTPYFIGGTIIIDKHAIDTVRPYLRPLSSMTTEEIEECYWIQQGAINVDFYRYDEGYEKSIDLPYFNSLIDFYNSHHLDYHGLIPMGLALEAPEGMYKTE